MRGTIHSYPMLPREQANAEDYASKKKKKKKILGPALHLVLAQRLPSPATMPSTQGSAFITASVTIHRPLRHPTSTRSNLCLPIVRPDAERCMLHFQPLVELPCLAANVQPRRVPTYIAVLSKAKWQNTAVPG